MHLNLTDKILKNKTRLFKNIHNQKSQHKKNKFEDKQAVQISKVQEILYYVDY